MKKQFITRNLQRHCKWLTDQTKETIPGGCKAGNIMVACFEVLHECGWSKESRNAWIDRWGFRRTLQRIQQRYTKPKGKRALRRLIDLAISALEACSWKTQFSVGALPLDREPKPMTAAQRGAVSLNMAQYHARRRREKEAREAALKARLSNEAAQDTGPLENMQKRRLKR